MFWMRLILFLLFGPIKTSNSNNYRKFHCKEQKECFNYELICEISGYEVRHYQASRWIATNVTSFFMEFANYEGFTKLFHYIQGKNEEGKKMAMTAPTLLKIPENDRIMENKNYTIHILLPAMYQENPPAPVDSDVYFIDLPEMYAFVKSFGGWLLTWNSKFYSSRLKTQLSKADRKFVSGYYYGAGYNSSEEVEVEDKEWGPMTLIDRHNEVWYIAEGTPGCSSSDPDLAI
ncbi:heme-binding protein 2-like isoform X1 [Rhinoraja longicauda]